MEVETTIAQGIHATNDSAGYDEACKRILSEKSILARIMKACLVEYKDCDVNEIAEKYIEGTPQVAAVPVLPDGGGTIINGMDTEDKSKREGTITYDIRFRAIVPGSGERISLIINVEAQVRHEVTQQIAEKAALSIWGNPTITGTSGNAVVRSIWDNAGKLIA